MATKTDFLSSNLPVGPSPQNKDTTIDAYPVYIAKPTGTNIKEGRAILYLTDSAGIWHNSRMLADDFAAKGYLTVVCFNAGVLRPEGASSLETETHNLTTTEILTHITTTLHTLQATYSIHSIGLIGYSTGAAWVLSLLSSLPLPILSIIKAGFIAHPLDISASMLSSIRKPLSIAAGGDDDLELPSPIEGVSPFSPFNSRSASPVNSSSYFPESNLRADCSASSSSTSLLLGGASPGDSLDGGATPVWTPFEFDANAAEAAGKGMRSKEMEVAVGAAGVEYEICVYEDVHTGFAVRRRGVTKEERWARERAFGQTLRWLDDWL